MHRNVPRTVALALVGLLVVSITVPAFAGTAVAHHDNDGDNPLDEILTEDHDEEDDGLISRLKGYVPNYLVESMAAIDGQLQRAYAGVSDKNPFSDPAPTNEQNAETFANSVAATNETYISFVNNASTPSESYDTHKVTFAHNASDPYTIYVVATIENDSVTAVNTYTESAFDDTGESVDVEWVVDGAAAADLSELTDNLATHIEDGKPIDRSKQAQLAGRYCDAQEVTDTGTPGKHCDIRSDLWMDHDALYTEVEGDA